MIDIVSKEMCVGCKACGDICNQNAILFQNDEEGFWYPKIDLSKCNHCNLCEKICPSLRPHYSSPDNRTVPDTYKAYNKNDTVRINSTSGGIYPAIAESFLEIGGYIVGCVYNDDYSGALHIVSNTKEGLQKIMRSKYFQSDTRGIFIIIRKLLKSGEKVLFCGAPCQASALYGFLGKNYDHLYTIDFICRGINSPFAYKKFIEELKIKYHSEIQEVHFKNKSHGWTNLGTLVRFKNGKRYYRNRITDPWVNAFIVGSLYIRPCCFNCTYKNFPRISDLTIGDFWGIPYTKKEEKYGVSVVLANNQKGDWLMNLAKNKITTEKYPLSLAVNGNPALTTSAFINQKRNAFFKRVKREPFSKVVWSLLGSNGFKRLILLIKLKLIRILKK